MSAQLAQPDTLMDHVVTHSNVLWTDTETDFIDACIKVLVWVLGEAATMSTEHMNPSFHTG